MVLKICYICINQLSKKGTSALRFSKLLIIIIFTALISGCATGYHSKSMSGGYSDLKIQDGMYQITFKSNANSSFDRTQNFAFLRASEVTLRDGYKFFVVIEERDISKNNSSTYGSNTTDKTKPRVMMKIQCFKERPDNYQSVYDAMQISNNIKSEYEIQ